jgi:hypothetical protein
MTFDSGSNFPRFSAIRVISDFSNGLPLLYVSSCAPSRLQLHFRPRWSDFNAIMKMLISGTNWFGVAGQGSLEAESMQLVRVSISDVSPSVPDTCIQHYWDLVRILESRDLPCIQGSFKISFSFWSSSKISLGTLWGADRVKSKLNTTERRSVACPTDSNKINERGSRCICSLQQKLDQLKRLLIYQTKRHHVPDDPNCDNKLGDWYSEHKLKRRTGSHHK